MCLLARVKTELEATGLPWEIVNGRRRRKIVVAGKLAGIMPLDTNKCREKGSERAAQNILSQIRRAARAR